MSSGRRWALMHELRGARRAAAAGTAERRCRAVDLVVVEGFKREPHRKIEVHRAANGKPLLFPDDPGIVGIATDVAVETALPIAHLDDIPAVAAMMLRVGDAGRRRAGEGVSARAEKQNGATVRRLLCLRRADDVGRRGRRHHRRAGHAGAEIETVALARGRRARSRARYRGAAAAAAFHQFRRRRLCRARARSAARSRAGVSRDRARRRPARRRERRSSPATRCGFSPARRCPMAPTPSSCRKTCASMRRQGRAAAGLKPGANVRPAGEDIPLGHVALKAGQRLRPQDVALAAAFGLTELEVRRRIRVAVFSTGNELVSPGDAARGRATVRFQPLHADGDAAPARLRGQRSRHLARRARVAGERA